MIHFEVPGRPIPKGRPRFGNGHTYTPKRTKDYEKEIAEAYLLKARGAWAEEGEVVLTIIAYYPQTRAAARRRPVGALYGQVAYKARPDLDNVVKAVLDGLNGIAYKDDKQVVSLEAKKFYAEGPGRERLEVMVAWNE